MLLCAEPIGLRNRCKSRLAAKFIVDSLSLSCAVSLVGAHCHSPHCPATTLEKSRTTDININVYWYLSLSVRMYNRINYVIKCSQKRRSKQRRKSNEMILCVCACARVSVFSHSVVEANSAEKRNTNMNEIRKRVRLVARPTVLRSNWST